MNQTFFRTQNLTQETMKFTFLYQLCSTNRRGGALHSSGVRLGCTVAGLPRRWAGLSLPRRWAWLAWAVAAPTASGCAGRGGAGLPKSSP